MARSAYTMQEMRDIVNYLVERNAYSETRGRSMWVNFADSGRTKRTWQSLKETFLKRILPDIHNPYFKLTKDQIASFRAGDDKTKKSSNHLDFRVVGETSRASDKDAAAPAIPALPSTAIGEQRHTNSDSTSERVEYNVGGNISQKDSPSKSLQDLIVYREPLTPMTSIIHDWDSDSDHTESENEKNTNTHSKHKPTAVTNKEDRTSGDNSKTKIKLKLKHKKSKTSKKEKEIKLSDDALHKNSFNLPNSSKDSHASPGNLQDISSCKDSSIEQLLKVLTDTILPNNPEGFEVLSKFLNTEVLGESEKLTLTNKLMDTTTKCVRICKQPKPNKGTRSKDDLTKRISDNSDISFENITPNTLSHTRKDKETVGVYSSVEQLLLKLSDSVLPNNQKEWIKKYIMKAQKSENLEKSDKLENSDKQENPDKQEHLGKRKKPVKHEKSEKKGKADNLEKSDKLEKSEKLVKFDQLEKPANNNAITSDEITPEFIDQSLNNSIDKDAQNAICTTRQAKQANEKSTNKTKIKSTKKRDNQSATRSTRKKAQRNNIDLDITLSLTGDNERTPSPAAVAKSASPDKEYKKESSTKTENVQGSIKHHNLVVSSQEKSETESYRDVVSSAKIEDEADKRVNTSETQSQLEEELRKILQSPTSSEKSVQRSGSKFVKATEKPDSELAITNPCLRSANLFDSNNQERTKREDKLEHNNNSAPKKSPVSTPQKPKSNSRDESAKSKSPKTDSDQKLSFSSNNMSAAAKSPGVVMLPSHSSESDSSTEPLRVQRSRIGMHRALPQLFGFANGNTRHINRLTKRKTISTRSSDSDSTTQDLEDQYVRISKNKPVYVRRPVSGRVQALEDGSMVAVVGRKVYAVVDHRGNRVYSLRLSRRGSVRDRNEGPIRVSSDSSAKPSRRTSSRSSRDSAIRPRERERSETVAPVVPAPPAAAASSPQTSLTLTKDSVTFTGDVEKIAALLPQLQQMLCGLGASTSADRWPAESAEPTDAEVRARVEAREAQIFQEIEQRAKKEGQQTMAPGRDQKSRSPRKPNDAHKTPDKNGATLTTPDKELRAQETRKRGRAKREAEKSHTEARTGRARRHPRKYEEPETHTSTESETEIVMQDDRPSKSKRSRKTEPSDPEPSTNSKESIEIDSDDSETLYALPTGRNHARNAPGKDIPMALVVDESSQGYQLTDDSLLVVRPKRRRTFFTDVRRRSIVSLASHRRPRRSQRRSVRALRVVSSDEEGVPSRVFTPNPAEMVDVDTPRLTPVEEQVDSVDVTTDTGTPENISVAREMSNSTAKLQMNSSNVSLPPSPEISIVENIYVPSCHPDVINRQLGASAAGDAARVSIAFDDVSMSCPLLERHSAIVGTKFGNASSQRSSSEEMEICLTTLDDYARVNPTVTESLLSKVNDVKINETTESMQNELNNLRLATFVNSPKHKSGRKTRCSTPNKKPKQRRSQAPSVACVTEEEHVERCCRVRTRSYVGTASLPPARVEQMKIPSIVVTGAEPKPIKWKVREPRPTKPKVIKVKILKPKQKNTGRKRRHTADFLQISSSQLSGKENDNHSANTLSESIHNHTDTCAATFVWDNSSSYSLSGDTSLPSDVMSIGNTRHSETTRHSGTTRHSEITRHSEANVSDSGVAFCVNTLSPSPDVFDEDARDATDAADMTSTVSCSDGLDLSRIGSMLTEDYDSATSWFLLSEDEDEHQMQSIRGRMLAEERQLREKYGAHIASLYPLACAVPHLSTVLEASDTRGSDSNPDTVGFVTRPASPASPK